MKNKFSHFQSDFPASIVVFLVAVPLCLGIALASGAPLFSGIIAGIIGGIVVGLLSGSQVGVSGPAAGLAVIVFSAIEQLGSFEIFLSAVVFSGLIQIGFGFAKAGIVAYYFPSSVIKGMLSGIGIIIILKQIPVAMGINGEAAFAGGFSGFAAAFSPGPLVITLVSLGILILWERPFIRRIKLTKWIQGPLAAVIAGIVMVLGFSKSEKFSVDSTQMVSIPVAESLPEFLDMFNFPDFSRFFTSEIWLIAATLAVVASLETLLCVEATDKLDPDKRITPTNRELKAQGVGNFISGLIGGLPVTQVIVRSSANIQAGGKTKTSAVMHGILLVVCVMTIPHVLNLVPLASLAAVLFVVGYKLAKPALFQAMYSKGVSQFAPFMTTVGGIVVFDLLIGIVLGIVVAVSFLLYTNYKLPYFFDPERHVEGERICLELAEDVSFLNKASILQTLNHIPEDSELIIDASKCFHIDPDVKEIIDDFMMKAPNLGIRVVYREPQETTRKSFVADEFGVVLRDAVKRRNFRQQARQKAGAS